MSEELRCRDLSRCILDKLKSIVQMVVILEKLNGPRRIFYIQAHHEVLLNNLLNFMSDMSEVLRSESAYSIGLAF